MRTRLLWVVCALFVLSALPASAMQRVWGECMKGAQTVTTVGLQSTSKVLASYPSCTVTVYLTGTLTLATLFSDNSSTPKANPFVADSFGYWFFYAANSRYDVQLSGGGLTGTYTFSDILASDLGSGGISSLNALTGATQLFATGTSGADFNVSSSGITHTFNCPTASASVRGCLSTTDWSAFSAKQGTLTPTAPITLAAGVIGITLPLTIAQGGTGQTTATNAFNALSPLTTAGDLLVYTSANARLGIGSNAQILTVDTSLGPKMKWSTCALCTLSIPLSVANGGTGVTAGTSGGVPYFSSTTTVASSGLLAAGGVVIGGGAATAPTTTGVATKYNADTLVGNGLGTVLFNSEVQTNATATATAQVLLTAPTAGTYLITYYLSTGSVTDVTATAQITFGWTDAVGAKVNTPQAALGLGAAANQEGTLLVRVASGNLTYTSTYAAGLGGNYNLTIVVLRF